MGHFLVERYVPAADEASLPAETQRLSAGVDQGVRLLLTLYTPEEESCLHVFDAPSLALLEHASRQAGVVFDRVSPVINVSANGGHEIRAESYGSDAIHGAL